VQDFAGMKVVIQNCDSNEYFAGEDQWVREPERAVIFPSSFDAMELMRESKLHPARVVLAFPEPRYNVSVAQTPDC
jgi:hypothetical protein